MKMAHYLWQSAKAQKILRWKLLSKGEKLGLRSCQSCSWRYRHARHTVKLLRFQVRQWQRLPVSHSFSSVCVVCHENTQTKAVKVKPSRASSISIFYQLLSTLSIAFYSPIQLRLQVEGEFPAQLTLFSIKHIVKRLYTGHFVNNSV